MTMALPTSESQNELLMKLMKHWNYQINSPKFNTINAWIRAYIHPTYGGFSIDKCNRIYVISEHKCDIDSYYDNSMCPGRGVYSADQDFVRPLKFQYWGYRQPSNTAGMENYVAMEIDRHGRGYSSYGAWNDVAGTSLQHTICEYNIPSIKGPGP